MGLYLTCTRNIYRRKAKAVFFFRDNSAFLIAHKSTKEILPNLKSNNVDSFKLLLEYASNNSIDGYEILLDKTLNKPELNNILKYISDYLLDKELSIGLLTKDASFYDINYKLFKEYGVTIAKPFDEWFERSFSYNCAYLPLSKKKSGIYLEMATPEGIKGHKRFEKGIRLKESFHDKLVRLINESGLDNTDIYNRGGITRQVFSKIYCTPTMIPKKETVICLAIGLRLPLFEAQELLKTAGYTLSESIMLDSIVKKYLEEEEYNLDLINSELNEYNCPLLGWHPR